MPAREGVLKPVRPGARASGEHTGAAAWLRLIEEGDGGGIRAALFRTSGDGEPAGFCFTRLNDCDYARGPAASSRQGALSYLAEFLVRCASPPPVLVLGSSAELPAGALAGGAPTCRVGLAEGRSDSGWEGPAEGRPVRASWMTGEPEWESPARRLFDRLMNRDDPLEPLARPGRLHPEEQPMLAVMVFPRPCALHHFDCQLPNRLRPPVLGPTSGPTSSMRLHGTG